jgi:tetratricopeptide (TPR) repeat protein
MGGAAFRLPLGLLALALASTAAAHQSSQARFELANEQVADEPGASAGYLALASLHRRHREFEAALREIDRAAEVAPDSSRIHYARGLTLLEAGQLGAADEVLSHFLAREPQDAAGLHARARARLGLGRAGGAASDFSLAIAHANEPGPDLHLEYAQALMACGRRGEAILALEAALEALGPVVALERAIVALEVESGRLESALDRLERIAQRRGNRGAWLAARAELLERLGREDEALDAYRLVLDGVERVPPGRRSARRNMLLERRVGEAIDRLSGDER